MHMCIYIYTYIYTIQIIYLCIFVCMTTYLHGDIPSGKTVLINMDKAYFQIDPDWCRWNAGDQQLAGFTDS